jgi:hypothetical protein
VVRALSVLWLATSVHVYASPTRRMLSPCLRIVVSDIEVANRHPHKLWLSFASYPRIQKKVSHSNHGAQYLAQQIAIKRDSSGTRLVRLLTYLKVLAPRFTRVLCSNSTTTNRQVKAASRRSSTPGHCPRSRLRILGSRVPATRLHVGRARPTAPRACARSSALIHEAQKG